MINTDFLSTQSERRREGFDHVSQVDDDDQHSTPTAMEIRTGNFLKRIIGKYVVQLFEIIVHICLTFFSYFTLRYNAPLKITSVSDEQKGLEAKI